MWKNLLSFEWNSWKKLSFGVFETKYPCLLKHVDDSWYLVYKINWSNHLLWTFLDRVFYYRPFITEKMLDDIEKYLQSNGIIVLKENIHDNVLDIIEWIQCNINKQIKKD